MKNKTIKSFSVLISAILFISIMPFNCLKAEESTPTYITLDASDYMYWWKYKYSGTFRYEAIKPSGDVRIVFFRNSNLSGNPNARYYMVSTQSFTNQQGTVNSSVDNGIPDSPPEWGNSQSSDSVVYDGITYYVYTNAEYNYSGYSNLELLTDTFISTSAMNSNTANKQLAIRYTYGDLAVDPEPDIIYGSLKIGFSTSIAYSGGNSNAWRLNKDTIWFDQYDTLGNDLRGLNIELQAVPYSTEASTKQNLLGKKFNEFFYDTVRVGSLGFYSPGQKPVDFTWEYITNRFSPTWWSTYGDNWSLTGWYLNEGWYKVGWAYRARVVDDELNTIIDWQWIYNATSVDAQDTDNIINNTGYDPDLVNSINNINNINNTTNNNYYNNQTINYNDTEPTSDGSWIEEMIRGIFSTIGTLIEMIGGVFSDLIKGLSDMIVDLGVDVLGFFRDIFDSITGNNQQIDLTLPEFNLTQNDLGALNEFKKLTNGYVAIFINSGMWFVIVVPLVMMLLKVVIKWKS